MARPVGWDILGLDSDPTPGVLETVQDLAKQFGDFAHDVEAAYRSLNGFASDANALDWVGQTAEAFKGQFGPLPGRLQKLYISYSEASDALSAYAPALASAQSKADSALRQAQDAHADLQRAQTSAKTAADDLKTAQQNHAANPNPQAVTDAQTAHDTAQTGLKNAQDHMAALAKQAGQAHDDLEAAAKSCAKALHHAQSDGIHNKHWWEHVGEFLSEWGGKIADIANDLAPFLDVLALATSWIPGVDVITAGLAEADNLIALAGTGLKIAGDAMQGHWGDALMGAGMLGLQFVGGKAIEKFGGKLMDKYGGKLMEKFGQKAEGNIGCFSAGDPVDVVSGQMISSELDLALPGVLSFELGRAYASDYEYGRLFGPGWSSTLDQRLAINEAGIHFVGDDAQTLHYPVPTDEAPVLPHEGLRWPLVWDRGTDEVHVTDPATGRVRHFAVVHHSTDEGQIRDLTALSDRNGNRVRFHRDDDGAPTGITLPGYRLAIETTATVAGPRIAGIRLLDSEDRATIVRTYRFDDRGRLSAVLDPLDQPYAYDYDEQDRLCAWTDRVGYRYSYEYGADSRVARGVGFEGILSASFSYDLDAGVTTVTDSTGHTTAFRYDAAGHIRRITDPLGNAVSMSYDRYGRLLSRTDELGLTTTFELDEHGDVARLLGPDGRAEDLAYNGLRQLASIRDGDLVQSLFTYDERGNLTSSADASGAVTGYEYDERGHCVAAVDAAGGRYRFVTDAAGLLIEATDPLGHTSRTERDAFGSVVAAIGPQGERTEMRRGPDGRLEARLLPGGGVESWEYDAQGRLAVEYEVTGASSRFEFGPFSMLRARTSPDGERHVFGYDTELRLTSVTRPDGRVWSYQHDAAGRLTTETDFNGRQLGYRYDAAGRLVEKLDGAASMRFGYGPAGLLTAWETIEGRTSVEYGPDGEPSRIAGPDCVIEYLRDAMGRILSETVDGRTSRYEYDVLGRRTSRTTPGGVVSTWTYDLAGRPVEFASAADSLTFAHDATGHETLRSLGSLALAQSWDASARLIGQELAGLGPDGRPDAQQTVRRRAYGYRADGVLQTIAGRPGDERRFDLTPNGRVTRVEAREWTETYVYDDVGTITHSTNSAAADDAVAGERVYSGTLLRAAGRRSYEYDERGRTVRVLTRTLSGQRRERRYTWDAEDRLARVDLPDGTAWAYRYDPLGRRTAKLRLGDDGTSVVEEVRFVWDDVRLAEQTSTVPDGRTRTVTWDWEPGTWQVVAQIEQEGERESGPAELDRRFFAIVADLAGSPAELVSAEGRVLSAAPTDLWGRRASADAPGRCPLGFPGQYHDDETGLDYNYARYYDPETGRYLSGDPLGLEPSPDPYAYVPNPTGWTDPLGLAPDLGPQWNNKGGNYYEMRPSNTPPNPLGTSERNHIPAKNAWNKLGIKDSLSTSYGPAIRMDKADHDVFISTGSSLKAQAWRARQGALILQGKWDVAMKMDIGMIRKQFGTKYDAHIAEMVADLPNNTRLQTMLSSNGWKIRTCLLK